MRKNLRNLLVALTLLVIPAASAKEDIQCYPGVYFYHPNQGWRCGIMYNLGNPTCMVCYMVMEVN